MPDIYFEDFAAGQEYELGSHTIDHAAIIEFASQFDPQPFHTDDAAAACARGHPNSVPSTAAWSSATGALCWSVWRARTA